jgi:hypothetical protein
VPGSLVDAPGVSKVSWIEAQGLSRKAETMLRSAGENLAVLMGLIGLADTIGVAHWVAVFPIVLTAYGAVRTAVQNHARRERIKVLARGDGVLNPRRSRGLMPGWVLGFCCHIGTYL